jgi:hypothetical protein
MPALAITRDEVGAADLRREAALTNHAYAAWRMLALALVVEGCAALRPPGPAAWTTRPCAIGCTATMPIG